MAATTQVKVAAAFRASEPLGSAGVRARCVAPTAQPTGTLIRPLEAVSATRLNESPLHSREFQKYAPKCKPLIKRPGGP